MSTTSTPARPPFEQASEHVARRPRRVRLDLPGLPEVGPDGVAVLRPSVDAVPAPEAFEVEAD